MDGLARGSRAFRRAAAIMDAQAPHGLMRAPKTFLYLCCAREEQEIAAHGRTF